MTSVTIKPDVSGVKGGLDAIVRQVAEALAQGLNAAGQVGVRHVVLEADARGIKARSGALFASIKSLEIDDLTIEVGVPDASPARKYAGLLTAGGIRPKKGRALTIPIGKGATRGGTGRFTSVADAEAQLGKQLFRVGRTLGFNDGRNKFQPVFVLVSHVRGRNVLEPAIDKAKDEMTEAVQQVVDEVIKEGGLG